VREDQLLLVPLLLDRRIADDAEPAPGADEEGQRLEPLVQVGHEHIMPGSGVTRSAVQIRPSGCREPGMETARAHQARVSMTLVRCSRRT
jgi:hypothetical protein